MTEVTNTGTQQKRRLPAWMLRGKSSDEIRSIGNINTISHATEKQSVPSSRRSISLKHDGANTLSGRTDVSDDFETLQKEKPKKRACKVGDKHSLVDTSVKKHTRGKRKLEKRIEGDEVKKQNGPASNKKRQTVRGAEKTKVSSSPGSDEDDIELTVEDLLCIAEEYVEADRKKQQECYTVRESESTKYSSTKMSTYSASCEINTLATLHSAGSSKALRKCSMTALTSNAIDTKVDRKNSEDVNLVKNVIRTGDAAQDMLNLLLGPLLNNPDDTMNELRDALTVSIPLTRDISNPVGKENWKEEISLSKKKGSLKDKVAMLLD